MYIAEYMFIAAYINIEVYENIFVTIYALFGNIPSSIIVNVVK